MNAVERLNMDEEERELFPILERALADTEAPTSSAEPGGPLNETMTVNRIVHQFPGTRPVFERLFINVPMEGCSCLDEVAWRHGMDSRELVHRLEEAVETCQCVPGKHRMEKAMAVR